MTFATAWRRAGVPAGVTLAVASRRMDPVPLLVGDLDDGPLATVTRGGVVEVDGARISWWVGAEDRWHRPAVEASTRDQRIDGVPVLESLVRVPSGDAAGRVGVARRSGRAASSVVLEVENRSPVPLALAVVVQSDADLAVTPRSISAGDDLAITLDREAFDHVVAADTEQALDTLEARDGIGDRPADTLQHSGVVALVAPLPHTATATVCIDLADDGRTPFDPASVPGLDKVVAGWHTHLAGAPRVEIGDESFESNLRAATCDVLLSGESAPPAAAALVGTPIGGVLASMIAEQRLNGGRRGDDPVAATAELVAAAGAWWNTGGDPAHAEPFVLAALAGARWLGSPRRRRAVASSVADVTDALGSIVGLLDDVGQHDAAVDVAALADRLGTDGRRDVDHPWRADDDRTAAERLTFAVRGAARTAPDGLRLLDGWEPSMFGRSLDVRGVPTRWGRVSYSVRWHGDRPALLWEIEPWDHRPPPATLRITAPAVDPAWSADAFTGDALLAAPAPAASFS